MTDTPRYDERDTPRSASALDVHIGERLRQARKLAGLSQSAMGEAVGVTFQQVQKYERGANRIPASRLYELAAVLGVPLGFFFDGFAPEGGWVHPPAAVGLKNISGPAAQGLLKALDEATEEQRVKVMAMLPGRKPA
ncbi:XRE family transcriptional regulator [Marinicauda algicola]|uniref:XRE family transcriptional regulator n=1 Tax=Marinicauda algicola TaxID=2029849 RepID=A0A4S2H192_9PROT|nr:helix-turn-helix transcriptional regulator [Marinicauda algicola]TGY89183.1 XRE family transcriptional regulator [Marinicauda algicola]